MDRSRLFLQESDVDINAVSFTATKTSDSLATALNDKILNFAQFMVSLGGTIGSVTCTVKAQASWDATNWFNLQDSGDLTLNSTTTTGTLDVFVVAPYVRAVMTYGGSGSSATIIAGVSLANVPINYHQKASGAGSFTTLAASGAVSLASTLAVTGVTTLTGALGAKLNLYAVGSAAASAGGLLMGVGTTANPAATSTADKKFIEIRTKSTATSGDSRNLYLRHDIGGAAGNGECARFITDLTAAAGTARGQQCSLQISDTGYVSGLGVGVDAQILVANAAVAAYGTYAGVNSEIYSAGSSSSVAAVTGLSFFRAANSGDGTGAGTVDDKAVLFDLSGFTSGAAKLWYDHQGTAPANVEEWIKVKTPAGLRWLPLYNAVV
jgi:hypothetical protein